MDHLRKTLEVLFLHQRSEDIISECFPKTNECKKRDSFYLDKEINESQFIHLLRSTGLHSSLDQLSVIQELLQSKWMVQDMDHDDLVFCKQDTVFNALLHFSRGTLHLRNGDPICYFQELLRWHSLTVLLGEDLLVTAYLAAHDLKRGEVRVNFDWEPYLNHDSREINAIFERPFVDLHAHLKGSSLNFELNWMCLMNHIEKRKDEFDQLSLHQQPTHSIKYNNKSNSHYTKVIQAAAIRLMLFYNYHNRDNQNQLLSEEFLLSILNVESEIKAIELAKDLQEKINSTTIEFGHNFENREDDKSYGIPDYGIEGHDPFIFAILGGERQIMYNTFRNIFNGTHDKPYISTLFYAYLVIKGQLRQEMIQQNSGVGFANFALYQDRKELFILEGSVYEKLVPQLSVISFLGRNPENRYLETRIAPKNTINENVEYIRRNEKSIQNNNFFLKPVFKEWNYHYIYHFIKKRDNTPDADKKESPRHRDLRKQIQCQAEAIYEFRNTGEFTEVGKVIGIDAANSEIYCRPEVFAQAFRFLREHKLDRKDRPNDLGFTYHVGEDFYDIVDGLRALEEVIFFLGFRSGDRLGHALALGTDVTRYYQRREYTISMTKQVLLDNTAWLYVKCLRTEGYNPTCAYLQEVFNHYFTYIYGENKNHCNILTYYQSWLLRGNDPLFFKEDSHETIKIIANQWNQCAFNNNFQEVREAQKNTVARHLYHQYHYDLEVKRKGEEGETLKFKEDVRKDLLKSIETIQQQLLTEIEKKHLVIECNPSSNYKIGEFDRYDEHPIIKFFNYGLNTEYPRHDISVSINTDDKGIFATSLEREYSLMALAMEKHYSEGHYNSPRAIVEWLDKIRAISLEQRFDKI